MELDEITGAVIDVAIRIHRALGPGLFESVYEAALAQLLERRGLRVERQRSIGFSYASIEFEQGFRLDLLVEERVVVEIKSLDRLAPVHRKQLLTYLRLANLRVGLLLNFGAETIKEGLVRVVNDLDPSMSRHLSVNQSRSTPKE